MPRRLDGQLHATLHGGLYVVQVYVASRRHQDESAGSGTCMRQGASQEAPKAQSGYSDGIAIIITIMINNTGKWAPQRAPIGAWRGRLRVYAEGRWGGGAKGGEASGGNETGGEGKGDEGSGEKARRGRTISDLAR